MPAISMFYGIIVRLCCPDDKQHKSPHIQAAYQEHEVTVAIHEGDILEGSLPPSKMKLLEAWMEIHRDELIADWNLAANGQEPYRIDPLR